MVVVVIALIVMVVVSERFLTLWLYYGYCSSGDSRLYDSSSGK